uniref:Ankyrin repeat domain-containing protein 50 n=1 Tax=Talaromyces marneffei PM1 TaxID=1077442 RepID=A0A093V039_TALMA
MEPSQDTEVPNDIEVSNEVGLIDTDVPVVSDFHENLEPPKEELAPEDVPPVDASGQSIEGGTQDHRAHTDNIEQEEYTVFSGDVLPSQDIVPSLLDVSRSFVPPNRDEQQIAVPRGDLSELDGKAGVYVYRPGTSTLVFRSQKKRNEILADSQGETLLKAVQFGQVDAVKLLLKAKVSTEFRDSEERTPLFYAVEYNRVDIVELLLQGKADWNARDKTKRSALHIAASDRHTRVIPRLLVIPGIELDAQDENCETPLHLAAKNGSPGTVKLLLEFGANVNAKDKKGLTPLHLAAARRDSFALVEMILTAKNIDVDARANNGRTPLMQACDRATSKDCEKVVRLLLAKNADPAAFDHNGETPVYLSAGNGNKENLIELIYGHRPIDINALTVDNRSALFGPARFGFTTVAILLLDEDINSTVKDHGGRTAFLEAAKYDKIEVARLIYADLVRKPGQEDKKFLQPALFEAAVQDSSQVARFLIEQGASMVEKDPTSQMTAMEIANEHGSFKVIAVLLERGDQLVSQGPSSGDPLQEVPPEAGPKNLEMEDIAVDLTFGFQSTIASFPKDTHKQYRIKRPQLRSVLYDHSPETIKYGLEDGQSTGKNFRWLHVPSNNIVWVNCKHLFGEEVWTRHQYQMSSPSVAHRRFIRPICQRIKRSETDDNLMVVLPYIHWETCSSREEMTGVIVDAMTRHLGDVQPPSILKELEEALREIDRIRNPKVDDDLDDDETTEYASSYWSSYYTASSSVSSDRRTRRTRRSGSPTPDIDVDWMARVSSEMFENTAVRARHAPTEKRSETLERRKKRIQRIAKVAEESCTSDEKLILAYMFDEIPLHFRRTLDQYYYYNLLTTEARDTDQVVSRYFKKIWPEDDNENLLLMVDQLWLWILDEDTVVTSFPQRWNKSEARTEFDPDPNNDSDIVECIIRQIGKNNRRPLEDVFDLAELIVSQCIGTMFEHHDIANEKLRFSDFFEASIGNVTFEESKMFIDFTELSSRLAKDDQNISTSDELKEDRKKLYDISQETNLVKEIKDIRDELHILSTVLEDQETVLDDMHENIRAMKAAKIERGETKKSETTLSYHSLPERVRMHQKVVHGLEKQAEKTYVALKDLLDLKQKQANVSEARTQGKQAAETARQGQTLMLFTIITVFFLPLSFMSSFFALNVDEFVRNSDGTFGLRYVAGIMFSVTVIVVAISLFFGFFWDRFLKFITYCKDLLRSFGRGVKRYSMSTLKILSLIIAIPFVIVLAMISISPGRSRSSTWFEEERAQRWSESLSDTDEVIVIEESSPPRRGRREYRRGRPYRSSKPTSNSVFAGLFLLLGLHSKPSTVVVERYLRPTSDPPRRYQGGWFGGQQRRRAETVSVEERYSRRRRSTSSIRRWYGDDERRSIPEKRNWLPWNWFKKPPAPARRSRERRVGNELSPTGLKRIYAWFIVHLITPLLKLFGVSKRTSEERASGTSSYFSYEYGSGTNSHVSSSVRGSDARSRRTHRSHRFYGN